jgi:hypothetical protein
MKKRVGPEAQLASCPFLAYERLVASKTNGETNVAPDTAPSESTVSNTTRVHMSVLKSVHMGVL